MPLTVPTNRLLGTVVLPTAGIFVLDLFTPLGLAEWLFYLLPVLATYSLGSPTAPLLVATVCTVLTTIGFFLSPPGIDPWLGLANRFMVAAALWITALLVRQRVRAVKVQSESAARVRDVIEHAPDGIVVADAGGKILVVNGQTEALFGYRRDEMIGRPVEMLLPERVRERHIGHRSQFAAHPTTRPMGNGRTLAGRRKDGREFPVEISLAPLQTAEGLLVMSSIRDITERKQADESLRDSDQRMRLATEATGVGIWEWNVITNKIRWDVQMFRIYGLPPTPDGFVNYGDWSGSVFPEDLRRQEEILQDTVRRLGHSRREFRIRRRDDGEPRIIQAVETVRTNAEEQAEWVVGTNLDITERRLAEVALQNAHDELEIKVSERTAELRARNEELKAFSYTVSHDLKAPLRGITGYGQELIREHKSGLDDRATFCLDQIVTASNNLGHLIEDLLHYSQLDREAPAITELDLNEMVAAIVKDRERIIAEQKTELSVSMPLTRVRGWDQGMRQVLTNLIDNAIKYSRKALPPRVEIRGEELSESYRITVKDNGIGFDMKYHDRIFGLFNRLVRADEFEGTGAGLAIVKKVIEKQGGRVWAESERGKGATFYAEWPKKISIPPAGLL